jgi:hypothetical protein
MSSTKLQCRGDRKLCNDKIHSSYRCINFIVQNVTNNNNNNSFSEICNNTVSQITTDMEVKAMIESRFLHCRKGKG